MPRRIRKSYSREVSLASTVPADDAGCMYSSDLCAYFYPMNPIIRPQVEVKHGELAPLTFGQHQDNAVVLNDTRGRIAPYHCVVNFRWDERTSTLETSLKSLTEAGVYVDNVKLRKGHSCILRNGAIICLVDFGTDNTDFAYMFHVLPSPNRSVSVLAENYQLCEMISQGKSSTVYRAIETATQDMYAVKIVSFKKMLPSVAKTSMECTLKEVELMRELKHPNVCKITEAFTSEEKTIQIVMEFLPHGSLLDYTNKYSGSSGLAEHITKDIMYQICDATLYLHSKMIVHRDLNPMNILVAQESPLVVKICDFDRSRQNKTFHQTCVGTPYYAAPELCVDNRRKTSKGYSRKVDSYSIGCIAFFLMTLNHPFVPGTHAPSLEMHIKHRKTDFSPLNGWKGTEVYNFIRGLLKEQPYSRLDMRAAKNHNWFNDYERQYVPSVNEYEDGFGPESGLYRLSPQKRGALQPIMEIPEDDIDVDMEPSDIYKRSTDSVEFGGNLWKEIFSVFPTVPTKDSAPLAQRRSPRKNEISEDDIDIDMEPSDIYKKYTDSMEFGINLWKEIVPVFPTVPAKDSAPLAQRRSPRRNRGQHPNRIKSRYLY